MSARNVGHILPSTLSLSPPGGNVSVKSKLQHSPRAYPGHLTSFPAREGGNLINLVFLGAGIWSLLIWGGEFDRKSRFHVASRADSTRGDKSWRRQAFMHSKRKIPDSWQTGWKAKACTSFVLYLKVFKNHLYLSLSASGAQLPKSFPGWGNLITWNGPMMGHLNSFSASGGGNLNKNFPKIQMSGGFPRGGGGMLKLRFDWYIMVRAKDDWVTFQTECSLLTSLYVTVHHWPICPLKLEVTTNVICCQKRQ